MLDISWISKTLGASLALSASLTLAEAPKRVVSVNLCTDQMAMLLASPNQLVSISFLSRDKVVSAMAKESQSYAVNHGSLEEIVALNPDLVLTHEWTSPLLENAINQLGIKTQRFATPKTIDAIPTFISSVGKALGQEEKANALIQNFQSELETQKSRINPNESPITIVNYGPNGWVVGTENLGAEFIKLSKFHDIADDLNLQYGGYLSLEQLTLAAPDLILLGATYPAHSQAESLLEHPAIRQASQKIHILKNGNAWACGLPQSINGLRELIDIKEKWNAS